MNSRCKIAILSACLLGTSLAGGAYAATYTFLDETINFPGYTSPVNGNPFLYDEYNTPRLESMTVITDDSGFLQYITFALHDDPGRQLYDSLFLNLDYGDGDSDLWGWDYFVHSGGNEHEDDTLGNLPGDGLWQVTQGQTIEYTYNESGGRIGHITGIDANSLTFASSLTGTHTPGAFEISYDFTSLSLYIGDSFAIAYSPWCANDLMFVSQESNPVPEPATLLLFGTGLAGISGLASVRKRRQQR